MNIDEIKKNARSRAAAARKAFAAQNPGAGESLRDQILNDVDNLGLSGPTIVSGFLPIGSEIDTRPVLKALVGLGHTTALPVVVGKAQPLVFRKWSPGDDLISGSFGTFEPSASADEVIPEVMLVPLLAFDHAGYRLGYGGGFYDRTIEKIECVAPIVTIGVAFSAQHVDTVPIGPYDKPLQWIATEIQLIRIAPGD